MLKIEGNVDGREFLELGLSYKEVKEEIGIAGYRAKDCSLNKAHQSCLWKLKSGILAINKHVLKHQMSTFHGNSGSPILVKRGKKHTVIAIHKGASPNATFNEARIITDDLIFNVLAWEKEMTDSRIRFSLMVNSDQETLQTDTTKWLEDKKVKLAVIVGQLQ